MPEKILQNEYYQFFVKILFPAFIAIGIKLAIQMKNGKMKVTALNVFLSMLIGIGGAYLASGWVMDYFEESKTSIVIAIIAMLSEKIGQWIIYEVKIDVFLNAVLNGVFDSITSLDKK